LGRRAVFLDRDGTLNVDMVHLVDPEDIRLLPGSAEAVRRLNDAGLVTVLITNQAVVARGWATVEQVEAANDKLQHLLEDAAGAHLDAMYYCPHHPEFSESCECRKPAPGMLVQAAQEMDLDLSQSYMVGDWWADIGAGIAAGTRTILVGKAVEGEQRVEEELSSRGLVPDTRVPSILEAVEWILSEIGTD
jgi:D-glycero-D-manno-heptose 1,7-bisphosphate phosphatase